jgi:hypothetical protein
MNIGYARNTDAEIPHLPHLQIVDEITFERAQYILDQRSKSFEPPLPPNYTKSIIADFTNGERKG